MPRLADLQQRETIELHGESLKYSSAINDGETLIIDRRYGCSMSAVVEQKLASLQRRAVRLLLGNAAKS